jgi:hypothetical protein
MIDYSFLRLKDNFELAKNMQDSPVTTHFFFNPIQLLPNKTYLQITNFENGISLDSDCEVFVVDCDDNVLADITDNVFIEEFNDANGNNQCKIEFVNLGVDFYRETVLIKFKMLSSNAEFWTNPINITSYQSERTVFFKYKNYDDFGGIGYTNANVWQSISLALYFDIPLDETETEDYFQISRNNTISARALEKVFEQYRIEQINNFTFVRLNKLLKHELIYVDDIRVTNKPVASSSERLGDSNYFETDVIFAKNYSDISFYDFQIFNGIEFTNFTPSGSVVLCSNLTEISFSLNVDSLILNTGTVTLYDSTNAVIETFTQSEMVVIGNTVTITTDLALTSDDYTFTISSGLITALGIETVQTSWSFNVSDGDWLPADFLDTDWLTGCPPEPNPIVDNLTLFYKFNETSGTTATDDSGLGNNGTIVNTLINQTGLIDKCYAFNTDGSTDDYVVIPDSDSLSLGSGAFSIEVWVNPDANFGNIINKYNTTTGDLEYRMILQSGIIQFYIYTDSSNWIGVSDNSLLGTLSWQQIVVTYDGSGDVSGLKIKIDNTPGGSAPFGLGTFTGMPNTTQDVYLGQQSENLTGANRYVGEMDILRIWKGYELTDLEITDLYNSGNGTETL